MYHPIRGATCVCHTETIPFGSSRPHLRRHSKRSSTIIACFYNIAIKHEMRLRQIVRCVSNTITRGGEVLQSRVKLAYTLVTCPVRPSAIAWPFHFAYQDQPRHRRNASISLLS